MCFGRKQIIKAKDLNYIADNKHNQVLFIREDEIVKSKKAMLEVPYTFNAIIVVGGGKVRFLPNGTHAVLETVQDVAAWKAGATVDIIYLPKETAVKVDWGTASRVLYRDPRSGKVVTVGAHGNFDLCVGDPDVFYRKTVGETKEFNIDEFKKRFSHLAAAYFTDTFMKTVDALALSYDRFSAEQLKIAGRMGRELSPIFEVDYGLKISQFTIEKIGISDADQKSVESVSLDAERRRCIQEYLAEIERLDDKQWEREKYLRQLEQNDRAAYYEVMKAIGVAAVADGGKAVKFKCPHCGADTAGAMFCSVCGKRIDNRPIVCQSCGTANSYAATFCSRCGHKL